MSPTTVLYVAQAIHGLAYGMLLFLVSSGLSLFALLIFATNINRTRRANVTAQ